MRHQYRTLKADHLEFSPNQTRKLALRRGEFFTQTILNFAVTVTAGASAPAGNLRYGGLFNLIRMIQLTLNNSDTFLKLSGAGLRTVIVRDQNRLPSGLVAPPMPAAGQSETVRFSAVIDHTLVNTVDYYMTGVDCRNERQIKDFDMEIDWGSVNDLYTTPNGATVSVSVEVEQAFLDRWIAPLVPRPEFIGRGKNRKRTGRTIQARLNPAVRTFKERIVENVDTSSTYLLAEIDQSNRTEMLRSVTAIGMVNGAANVNVISGDLLIEQGTETLTKCSVAGLQERVTNWREGFHEPGVVEIPFGYARETAGFKNMRTFRDDLEIRAYVADWTGTFGPSSLLVITESWRQEKRR